MWKEKINRLTFLSICLVACFPLLSMKMTVYAIIVFSFFSLLSGIFVNPVGKSPVRIKELAVFLLPFILIFFRTFIFDNSDQSIFYLEVSLSLAVFPIVFYLSSAHYSRQNLRIIGLVFVMSTVAITIYGQAKVLMRLMEHFGPNKFWKSTSEMFNDPSLPYHVRTIFEEIVTIHPTHASLFLGISILILADMVMSEWKQFTSTRKWLMISAILIIMFLQVILASRTPFIGTIICLLLLLFLHMKNKIRALYFAGMLVAVSVILIALVPTFSARFKEVSLSNTELPTENHENSFNLRTGIYKCSFNIISENWLLGVGPGNVQKELNSCYSNISKEVYDEKNYNTHNQFLDYWAGLGIVGPVSLMLILGYTFISNLRKKIMLPVALSLLFALAFVTENLLTRQNGVVPFAFFIGLFFYTPPSIKGNGTVS